ncbi:MAG: hypothetical protein KKF56_03940 [Nanoarchaeota archaeon]|nr:hypothetical protein [Nanoarchaeota archaeon]
MWRDIVVDRVVKIDGELLKKIERFVKDNKFEYSSKKQVVNLAILEFLNSKSLDNSSKGGQK